MGTHLFKQAISDVITLSNAPIEFKNHTLSLLENIENEHDCHEFISQFDINDLPSNNFFLENNSFNSLLLENGKDDALKHKTYKLYKFILSLVNSKPGSSRRQQLIDLIHKEQGVSDLAAIDQNTVKQYIEIPGGYSKEFIQTEADINETYITQNVPKRKQLLIKRKQLITNDKHVTNFNIRNKDDLYNHEIHNRSKNSIYRKIGELVKTVGNNAINIGKYSVAVAGITGAVYGAYLLFKYLKDHYTGKCKELKGISQKICILKIKIEAIKKSIQKLEKDYNNCKYTKNPDKCKISIKNHIYNWSTRLKKYEDRLNILSHSAESSKPITHNTSQTTNNKFHRRKRK